MNAMNETNEAQATIATTEDQAAELCRLADIHLPAPRWERAPYADPWLAYTVPHLSMTQLARLIDAARAKPQL